MKKAIAAVVVAGAAILFGCGFCAGAVVAGTRAPKNEKPYDAYGPGVHLVMSDAGTPDPGDDYVVDFETAP